MSFPEDLEFYEILIELMSSLSKPKDIFQSIVQELNRGSFSNWSNIMPLLSAVYKRYFPYITSYTSSNKNKYEKFICSVITLFDMYKCSDMSVIAGVLERLCIIRCEGFSIPEFYISKRKVKIRLNYENSERYLPAFENLLVLSYKDIPSVLLPIIESKFSYLLRNWVKIVTNFPQVHLLQTLISFGATLIVPQEEEFQLQDVNETMDLLLYVREGENYDSDSRCRVIQNWKSMFNEPCRRRRLFLVTTVLQVLFQRNFDTAANEYMECLEILIESTPEPFITSEEIKSSLADLCSGVTLTENLQQTLEMYESYFPESREASKPRSLRHLSRFQVRECLRSARSFPYGVESLGVPKNIQDYICFKDILL